MSNITAEGRTESDINIVASSDDTIAKLTTQINDLRQELDKKADLLATTLQRNQELDTIILRMQLERMTTYPWSFIASSSSNTPLVCCDTGKAAELTRLPTNMTTPPLHPDGRPSCEPKPRLKIGLPWRLLVKAVLPYEGGEHVWSIGAPYHGQLMWQLKQYYGDKVSWKTQIKYHRDCDGEWMVVENDKDVKLAYKDWQYSCEEEATWLRLFIVVP